MADRRSERALSDFIAEAQENVEALDKGLILLDDTRRGQEADPDTLNAVFRAAHTLKGLCSMFGVERMTTLAHALEDRLDDLRMGRSPLDQAALTLLLSVPSLFGKLVAEEATQKQQEATSAEVRVLAAKLRGAAPEAPAPVDTLSDLALEEGVRAVLTEYEEHRLRANLAKGVHFYRARLQFDLDSFDTGLEKLKKRLKPIGEVIATLPSSEPTDPNSIAFEVVFGSMEPLERARVAAGESASVEEIPRRSAAGPGAVTEGAAAQAAGAGAGVGAAPVAQSRASTAAAGAAARSGEGATRPEMLPVESLPPPAPEKSAGASAHPLAVEAAVAEHFTPDSTLRSVSQAVRVDIGKLDRLMNLVGELVLVKTSLLDLAERMRSGDPSTTLGLEIHRESRALDRKLNELQSGILEVRMVPLDQIFDKLSRMVRKIARDLGKQVDFEVHGGEVELDKLIVEELSDPLMHLIRNALDHAIETPDVREAAGKRIAGRVALSAEQKGSHVLIAVEDDGAGIDEARIREVALLRGALSSEAAAQLSRRELLNLIFLPGVSTAKEVSALSGRGVGMDVVKNNIAAMSGIIDLFTEVGKGTRFEITLPVTLAIIRALVVAAGERNYAVPLTSVLEIVTILPSQLRTIEMREVISLRGSTLPLIRLGRYFNSERSASALLDPPSEGPLFVVVVGLAQERLGIAVDGLVGQQDIVVKPLGRALTGVRGISGATDLGNRRTILVLDVGAIIEEVVHGDGLVDVL